MAAGMNTDSFEVNVKDFQGRSVVIRVDPTWDVSRIKREISNQTRVTPNDFRIVFAGQTLADNQTLWVMVYMNCTIAHTCTCINSMPVAGQVL